MAPAAAGDHLLAAQPARVELSCPSPSDPLLMSRKALQVRETVLKQVFGSFEVCGWEQGVGGASACVFYS